MKTNNCKGVNISALSLGTVQLGLNYGVNNTDGKPSQEQANQILDCALANGINTLDTASGYGDSEMVIGNWLKTVEPEKRPFIVTKVAGLDHSSLDNLRKDLHNQVSACKQRLGVERLDALMLHHFDEYLCDKDNVVRALHELRESGEVRFIGSSAYSHHDYTELASLGFDVTQIPLNLFDWEQIENGGLKKLEESGMMIFVRSVYLQGLVFQDPDNLAPNMEFARDTLVKFRALCSKHNMSPAALALSYALSLSGVTSLVLGSEKVEQVEQNAQLFEQAVELTAEQMAEMRENFLDTPVRVKNPHLWKPEVWEAYQNGKI